MSTTIYSKFFYVYKITNLINNKIYIGVHQSHSLNDDYMGSGIALKRAQQKYGIENFKKEILFVYDNKDDMFAKEKEIVNESFVQDKSTYNLKVGGDGGWDYINTSGKNLYGRNGKTPNIKENLNRGRETLKQKLQDEDYKKEFCEKISKQVKEYYSKNESVWTGRSHRNDSKEKIGAKSKIHQAGKNNSQYGTMWAHDIVTKENKKIKKTDIMPDGLAKGKYKVIKEVKPKIKVDNGKLEKRILFAKELYERHINGMSTRELAKIFNKSHVTIAKEINFYKLKKDTT